MRYPGRRRRSFADDVLLAVIHNVRIDVTALVLLIAVMGLENVVAVEATVNFRRGRFSGMMQLGLQMLTKIGSAPFTADRR